MSKSVLITGCSSGIGLDIAHTLHQLGWQVFASCRHDEDVNRLATESPFRVLQLDLSDNHSIAAACDEVFTECNFKLDALINNGAYGQPGAVEDLTREALLEQFQTNVFGTQILTNRVIPIMRQQGSGRIVQISSVLGFVALPFRGAYNASKYALEGLSDTLRLELSDSNIKLSIVQPGPIESEFRANALAMYQHHINPTNSHFKALYPLVEERLTSTTPAKYTLPASAVSAAVVHALDSTKPKIRYRVTTPTKLMWFLKRILSGRLLDKFLLKNAN